MPIQLDPREYFVICRQISDPKDTNTYYVQAIIRNAKTDVLLDTVNLTDKGNQRFTKEWQVPADPSGEGLYIVITTRVYTNSGYTTESALYSVNQEEFLVQKRYNPVYGGGGGVSIDYKKVKNIVQKEIKRIPKTEFPSIKFPKQEKVDVDSILRAIYNIRIPEQEKIDFSPVLKAIRNIYIPLPKEVDLRPLLSAIAEVQNKLRDNEKISKESEKTLLEKITKQINDSFSIVNKKVESAPMVKMFNEEPKKETKKRKWY